MQPHQMHDMILSIEICGENYNKLLQQITTFSHSITLTRSIGVIAGMIAASQNYVSDGVVSRDLDFEGHAIRILP
jgi:hypothetical protein